MTAGQRGNIRATRVYGWKKVLLLLAILILGGVNSVYSVDYTYYIVRSNGNTDFKVVKSVANTSDEIQIPEEIRTPYIPLEALGGYRYFTSETDAKNYSADKTVVGGTVIADNATYADVSGTNIYVGYYYDESQKPADLPKLDGTTTYRISHTQNADGTSTLRWLYADFRCGWSDMKFDHPSHLWMFGGGDPYNIKLTNKQQSGKECSVGTMSGSLPLLGTSATTGSGSSFMIVGSSTDTNGYNLAKINSSIGNTYLAFLMDSHGWGGAEYEHMRTNANRGSSLIYRSASATSKLTFTEAALTAVKTFKVINKAGNVALQLDISYEGELPVTVTLPDELRSPYIPDNSNYRFYKSGNTAGARDFTDENFTSFADLDDVILVGYYFDQHTSVPSGLPKLDGKTEYYFKSVATGNYLYGGGNGAWNGSNGETDVYKWWFSGYDPYNIKLYNVGKAQYASFGQQCDNSRHMGFNNSGSSFVVTGTTPNNISIGVIDYLSYQNQTRYMAFVVDATKVGNTSVAPDPSEVFRTNYGSTLGHVVTSDFDGGSLMFTPVKSTVTYTYKVVSKKGKIAVTAENEQTAGNQPSAPTAVRSPFVAETGYHYYAEDQFTESSGSYTLNNGATELTTLPDEDAIVYVTYDVKENLPIDLEGYTPYNLVASGTQYLKGVNGYVAAASADANMLWAFFGNDPYDIQLVNYGDKADREGTANYLVKTTQNAGNMSLQTTKPTTEAVQTFYLTYHQSKVSGTKYALAPTGNVIGGASEYYLQYDGTNLTLAQTAIASLTDGSWLQPVRYNFNYTWEVHCGVDGNGGVAVTHVSHSPIVMLPRAIRSPLLKKYDYYDITNGDDDSRIKLTEGASLSWADHTLKATYDYTDTDDYQNADFNIDLNGDYQYLLSDRANYRPYDPDGGTDKWVTLTAGSSNPRTPTDDELKGEVSGKQGLKWLFKGNDPYSVEIRNANDTKWDGYVMAASAFATDENAYQAKSVDGTRQRLKMVTDAASYTVNRFAIVYDNDFEGNEYANDGGETLTDWHVALMAKGSTDSKANFVRSYVGRTDTQYNVTDNFVEVVKLPLDDTGEYFQMNYTDGTRRYGGTVFIWKAIQRREYRYHLKFQDEDHEATATYSVGDDIVYPASLPTPAMECEFAYYTDAEMTNRVTTFPSGTGTIDLYVKLVSYTSHQDIKLIPTSEFDPATNENWYFLVLARTDGAEKRDMPIRTRNEDNKVWYRGGDKAAMAYEYLELFQDPEAVSAKESRYLDRESLAGDYLWAFVGNDPLNVRIYNKKTGKYLTRKQNAVTTDSVYVYDDDESGYHSSWVLHEKFYKATYASEPDKDDNTLFSVYCQENGNSLGLTSLSGLSIVSRPTSNYSSYNTAYGVETKSSNTSFNFKAIPYKNYVYQPVKLVVRDETHAADGGLDYVYTAEDKYYAEGDVIGFGISNAGLPSIPEDMQLSFLDYQMYSDEWTTKVSDYTVQEGSNVVYFDYQISDGFPVKFFKTESDLRNAADQGSAWCFLQMGVGEDGEGGSGNLGEYYGVNDSRTTAAERSAMTAAEKTFVNKNGSYGLHFLAREKGMTDASVDDYGRQEAVTDTEEKVLPLYGNHYIESLKKTAEVELLSPRNDFRRIAETYKDGGDVNFREARWLWGFVGTPFKFRLVNKEAYVGGAYKYLTANIPDFNYLNEYIGNLDVRLSTRSESLKTTYGETYGTGYEWTMAQMGYEGEAAAGTFAIKVYQEATDHSAAQYLGTYSSVNPQVTVLATPENDDARKQRSLKAYRWNWSDTKYKTVTVNIKNSKGQVVLTKTYTPADRAFMAGDVIDATDGHFLLPHTGDDNFIGDAASDNHKLNIPFELKRHFCRYTVEGGSFTVQDTDAEQTLNISYTVDTPEDGNPFTPRFVDETEFTKFTNMKSDTEVFKTVTDKGGKAVKLTRDSYYSFLNFGNTLSHFAHVAPEDNWNDSYQVTTSTGRFQLDDANKLKWYFVGDPYKMRVYNVYTSFVKTDTHDTHPDYTLARNKNKGNVSLGSSDDQSFYNKAFMQGAEAFEWEMVDAAPRADGKVYIEANGDISYRIDKLRTDDYGTLAFALRMKQNNVAGESDGNGGTKTGIGSCFYLSNRNSYDGATLDRNVTGAPLYYYNNDKLNARGNKISNALLTFPDFYHTANYNMDGDAKNCAITALPYAQVYLTVYDHENVNKIVTDMERSDFYVQTERFCGVPNNLQRQFCNYTWVGNVNDFTTKNVVPTNLSDPSASGNNILNDSYVEMANTQNHLFATYVETDDSPFSMLGDDGRPALKRETLGASAWYNMSIAGAWAFFNSNLIGQQYGSAEGSLNDHLLTFDSRGLVKNPSSDSSWPFYKGLHWALIGDPYRFTLLCQRDRILNNGAQDGDGNYSYESAYIVEAASGEQIELGTSGKAVEWTLMRNGTTSDSSPQYFLSQADTRKTEVARTGKYAYDYTFGDYSADNSYNVKRNNSSSEYDKTGNNYSLGHTVVLRSENTADNECFDAIVNVYNKMNELVATTGWTELPRNNETWSGELPTDIKRWGCEYQYWGDETMTLYPFKNYSQKIGADGKLTTGTGDYLIKDGGIVYVNYSYDESLYSSENEYRWMNPFFNWDVQRKVWNQKTEPVYWYTAEQWAWNTATNKYERMKSVVHTRNATFYLKDGEPLYTETRQRWMESPKDNIEDGENSQGNSGTYSKDKAWVYAPSQYKNNAENEKNQKWALIGDPYRFILYNYNRYKDATAADRNSYYLYCDESGNISNVDFGELADRATHQGIYWTWKMSNSTYRFGSAETDVEDPTQITGTAYTLPEGLPESMYKKDAANNTVLQTGYLALCDMGAKSLYDATKLVGSVKGYATFNNREKLTEVEDESKEKLSVTYGNKMKFYGFITQENEQNWLNEENAENRYPNIPEGQKWTPNYRTNDNYAKWRDLFGVDGNGVYQGPTENYNSEYVSWKDIVPKVSDEESAGNAPAGYSIGGWETVKPTAGIEEEQQVETYAFKQVETACDDTEKYLVLTGGPTGSDGALNITGSKGTADRFLVMPMASSAGSITFHLDVTGHDDTKRSFTENPVYDHTTEKYGVGNTLTLPWMMRREFCDYTYHVIDFETNKELAPADNGNVDDLVYGGDDGKGYNKGRLESRGDGYKTFWKDNADKSSLKLTDLEVPEAWKDKHVYISVTYQPSAEFKAARTAGSASDAANVKWLQLQTQGHDKVMRYTRTDNVTANAGDQGVHTTNDYLWAVEGDPYGFYLHNRYASHWFNETDDGETFTVNSTWADNRLTTDIVNTKEVFNYSDAGNEHFGDADESGNYSRRAGIEVTKEKHVATDVEEEKDSKATMGTGGYPLYEAMTGNYSGAMAIHPVKAPVNVKNQNGYKYYSAFLFNAASDDNPDFPVQLNYLQDYYAMSNVFCNWRFKQPTAAQFLPYFERAGYVGGLKPEITNNTSFGDDHLNVVELYRRLKANDYADTDEGQAQKASDLETARLLTSNPANLVALKSGGYYRLKAYSAFDDGVKGSLGGEYVSGYLHKLELDTEDASNSEPLHFYGKPGASGTLATLDYNESNAWAAGFEERIEVMDTEYDPSSIFRVTRNDDGYIQLETQGLTVSGNKMIATPASVGDLTENELFQMQDIGQTAFQVRTKASATAATPIETAFMSYAPSTSKYSVNTSAAELSKTDNVHDTKWLLEPVQTGSLTGATVENAAKVVYQHPLRLAMNDVGGDNYFATVCFPYNVKLPTGAYAYSCIATGMRNGEKQQSASGSEYYSVNITQIAGDDEDSPTVGGVHNRVIPANVPALVYVDGGDIDGTTEVVKTGGKVTNVPFTIVDDSEIQMTAETLAKLQSEDNPLKYQLLTQELTVPDNKKVYVFSKSGSMVGFMRNTTSDYMGQANNRFVLHNKLYYLDDASDGGAGAKFFVLNFMGFDNDAVVVTDLDEVDADVVPVNTSPTVKEGIYDLQGRKLDRIVRSGVYIINGKKVVVRK